MHRRYSFSYETAAQKTSRQSSEALTRQQLYGTADANQNESGHRHNTECPSQRQQFSMHATAKSGKPLTVPWQPERHGKTLQFYLTNGQNLLHG